MAGLWVIRIKPSQEGLRGNGGWEVGMGKWGSPPEKVWWLPVLLIFYSDFKFLTRMSGIKDKHGYLSSANRYSSNFWSIRLLW